MNRLLIIDGNSIANRAFYGIRVLTNHKGVPTNAIYGFLNIMLKAVEERNPDYICVAFDLRAPTFRHKEYDLYKAQRKKMPDELAVQLPLLQEVLSAMNIPCLTAEGFEADDIIGTVSKQCGKESVACEILTGDKDDLQLIDDCTSVLLTTTKMGNTETELYTADTVMERFGLTPAQIIDLKGLMGDSSDNIPGVRGVGEKTALSLLQRFGSVEALYDELGAATDIKGSLREKLTQGRDDAFLSKRLATIVRDVPTDFSFEAARRTTAYKENLYSLLQELELFKLIERLQVEGSGNCTETFEITWTDANDFKISDGDALTFVTDENGATVVTSDGVRFSYFDSVPKEILSDSKIKKRTHCSYRIYLLCPEADGIVFDTELAAYLLDVLSEKYPISRLSEVYLKKTIVAEAGKQRLGEECAAVYQLSKVFSELLQNEGMTALFTDVEMPLAKVLADMHRIGIGARKDILEEQGKTLGILLEEQANAIYAMAGETFNINSPKQSGVILFEKLELPHKKKTKSGYSTSADVLEKLRFAHPIVDAILNYRQVMKLKSTYTDGLVPYIEEDGRIHSHFNQTVTATGRLSSTEPNLQNIPVRTEEAKMIRKAFCAREGYHFLSADYSQIELRILAHVSSDEKMIAAFNEGVDIHTKTAALIFGTSVDAVTDAMRSSAKTINFGILYGMGDFSLGNDLGISRRQAAEYIENYLNTYPKVRDYLEQVIDEARENGYVSTMFGRRRPMPELSASNFIVRSFGERVAKNAPIQGAAADIIKMAMVRVYRRLLGENLKSRLILQVHDELILEVADEEETYVTALLRQEMEEVVTLSVPLPVSVSKAKDWYHL